MIEESVVVNNKPSQEPRTAQPAHAERKADGSRVKLMRNRKPSRKEHKHEVASLAHHYLQPVIKQEKK